MRLLDKEDFLDIKYLDNHVLVLLKKSNMLTQSTKENNFSLEIKAKRWIKKKFNKKKEVFLHPVHRLDKETAGLVLFAKTSKALSRLNEQMRQNKIRRKYMAEVEGKLEEKQKELKDYILHLSHRAKIVDKDQKKAKFAHLSYKVLKEKKASTIVEIELFTGRYHQIRAQFANISHPVLGDKKYNSKKSLKKIHLQCCYLEFFHPITKEKIRLKVKSFF